MVVGSKNVGQNAKKLQLSLYRISQMKDETEFNINRISLYLFENCNLLVKHILICLATDPRTAI